MADIRVPLVLLGVTLSWALRGQDPDDKMAQQAKALADNSEQQNLMLRPCMVKEKNQRPNIALRLPHMHQGMTPHNKHTHYKNPISFRGQEPRAASLKHLEGFKVTLEC